MSQLAAYPPIYIKREALIGSSQAIPARFNLDRPILMTPRNEPLPKRLARICFEEGPVQALNEADQKTKGQNINFIFRGLCYCLAKAKQFNHFLWPYMDSQDLKNLNDYSQTRYV